MITSSSNDKIKQIKKLIKSASYRKEQHSYVVEGIRMVREIPREDILAVYVAEHAQEKFSDFIKECPNDIVEIVSDSVFASMSDTKTPQGILAVTAMRTKKLEDLFPKDEAAFLLLVENLQDPGNLGTILRTAEAAGVTGVVLSPDCVDMYNPKVIRSTMGAVFRVAVYRAQDFLATIQELKNKGVVVYGAHLDGGTFYEKDYSKACAFLIGNEGNGLSQEVSAQADSLIRIPMCGKVESLNAAISTAVISYEVLRQRM